MNGHPIDPFLAAWSAASGVDGFAFRLRVYRALELPGPWTRNRLKSVLASLLVPDARQRDRFESVFDTWFLFDEAPEQPLAPTDVHAWLDALAKQLGPPKSDPPEPAPRSEPMRISKRQPPARKRRRWPWLVAVVLMLAIAAGLVWRSKHSTTSPAPSATSSAISAPQPSANTSDESGDVPQTVRTYPKLEFEVTEAPPPRWKAWLLIAAAALLLLALGIEAIAYWRRRRFDKPRVEPIEFTDDTSELDFGSGYAPQPLSAAVLDRLAYRTGLMPDHDLPRLNVRQTVKQTAKNAGSFVPVYDPRTQTRGLSVVRPVTMEPIAEAMFHCFVAGLQARGVPVHVTTGAPRWDTYELVLLFVNAEDPSDPPVERWRTIPNLALVELRDAQSFGPEVERLPRGVFECTPDGLYAALDAAALQRQPPPRPAGSRMDPLASLHAESLGSALPLAIACSIISPCDLGTADRMRRDLLPDISFLSFRRVLALRGVSQDGPLWRFAPALARELRERTGARFIRRVLEWQAARLSQLEAPSGSRAERILERERIVTALELQLIECSEGPRQEAPSETELLRTVQKLEMQLDQSSLERRLRERLWTLPKQWLLGRVPRVITWKLGRIRGDASELLKGEDPSKRLRWLWLLDEALIAGGVVLLLAAKPNLGIPGFHLDANPMVGFIWAAKAGSVQGCSSGICDDKSLTAAELVLALKGHRKPQSFSEGTVEFIGFAAGSPPLSRNETIGRRSFMLRLMPPRQLEPSQNWTCVNKRFSLQGPERLMSIVSLPTSADYDELSQQLLDNGIATCVVREPKMSLPVHADVAAQTYRYDGPPGGFPKQKAEGYSVGGFWIPAERVASAENKTIDNLTSSPHESGRRAPAGARPRAELIAELASVGVEYREGGYYANSLTPQAVQWLNELDEAITLFLHPNGTSDFDYIGQLKRLAHLGLEFARVSDLSPLKGIRVRSLNLTGTQVTDLSPLKGMPLASLYLPLTPVNDLSPLKGMPLTALGLGGTQVSDLSPLKGMSLTGLNASGTRVRDLSPLIGMPFKWLYLSGTRVSDLSPLKGMPLTELTLDNTQVSDLSPLKGMPLTKLSIDGLENQVKDWSPVPERLRPKTWHIDAGVAVTCAPVTREDSAVAPGEASEVVSPPAAPVAPTDAAVAPAEPSEVVSPPAAP